jgi:hypothetical protein
MAFKKQRINILLIIILIFLNKENYKTRILKA